MLDRKNLLPCPFCGDDWYVYLVEPEGDETEWAVGCFAQMEGGCGFSSEFTSEKYAIEAWNKRCEKMIAKVRKP